MNYALTEFLSQSLAAAISGKEMDDMPAFGKGAAYLLRPNVPRVFRVPELQYSHSHANSQP